MPRLKTKNDLLNEMSKDELLVLIRSRMLFFGVSEREILLVKIEALQNRADAAFEKYQALILPEPGNGRNDRCAFYTAMATKEKSFQRYKRISTRIEQYLRRIDKLKKVSIDNIR